MKQTALQKFIEWGGEMLLDNHPETLSFAEALEKAVELLELEKEQIEEAYSDGVDDERYDRELKLGKYYQSVFKEDKE